MYKKFSNLDTFVKAYLACSSIGILLSIVLLVLRFVYNIYIVDPYYLICCLIISTTLFLTVIVSLRDKNGVKGDEDESRVYK